MDSVFDKWEENEEGADRDATKNGGGESIACPSLPPDTSKHDKATKCCTSST